MDDLKLIEHQLVREDLLLAEADRYVRLQEAIVAEFRQRGDNIKLASELLVNFMTARRFHQRAWDRLMRERARIIREHPKAQ